MTAGMVFLSDSGAGTGQLIVILGEGFDRGDGIFSGIVLAGVKG